MGSSGFFPHHKKTPDRFQSEAQTVRRGDLGRVNVERKVFNGGLPRGLNDSLFMEKAGPFRGGSCDSRRGTYRPRSPAPMPATLIGWTGEQTIRNARNGAGSQITDCRKRRQRGSVPPAIMNTRALTIPILVLATLALSGVGCTSIDARTQSERDEQLIGKTVAEVIALTGLRFDGVIEEPPFISRGIEGFVRGGALLRLYVGRGEFRRDMNWKLSEFLSLPVEGVARREKGSWSVYGETMLMQPRE